MLSFPPVHMTTGFFILSRASSATMLEICSFAPSDSPSARPIASPVVGDRLCLILTPSTDGTLDI